MNETPPVLSCKGIKKSFSEGSLSVDVLKNVSLEISQGEKVSIVGASGTGKSTLLHILGGLDSPTSGEVWVDGENMNSLSNTRRGLLRNRSLGFVYQFHHLLPEFTALENVSMPLLIRDESVASATGLALEMLAKVGLEHRVDHKPGELSGGERQRAALARALVTRPKCVLADEPTGNLDYATAEKMYVLMQDLNVLYGISFVIVTHDLELASKMDRTLQILDGEIIDNTI